MQDAFTPISFGTDGRGNRVIVRAIVPRVPKSTVRFGVTMAFPDFRPW